MPDALYPSAERFNVVECEQCGLGYVNPRPSPAEMQRYYPPDYYAGFVEDSSYHQARYGRQAVYLEAVRSSAAAPRLLDVGCAHGDFPRFMKQRGWDVEGVEFSSATRPITDFKVYREDFATAPIAPGQYDAVTAWAVMEHLHDPAAYFRKVSRVLRPGGIFVFLVTNFHSLASRSLFGEDVPRHLHFFSEATVRRYLADVGLTLESADYSNSIFAMPATNWLPYLLRRLTGRPFRWEDRRSLVQFRRTHHLAGGASSALRFFLSSPISALDRALVPLLDRYFMWRRSYSIVTYVGRKTTSADGAARA
jgi:SAM-dependent methyltransferase